MSSIKRLCVHVGYLAACIFFILPLWWSIGSSLQPLDDIFKYVSPFSLKALIPDKITLGLVGVAAREHKRLGPKTSLVSGPN
jgi:ABC-type glycerol-3-phosphate transport system permease component